MPINKTGSPIKITNVIKTAEEFNATWEKIGAENTLIRCIQCKHLLSKRSGNAITLKHKKMASIITGGTVDVICPNCSTVNKLT